MNTNGTKQTIQVSNPQIIVIEVDQFSTGFPTSFAEFAERLVASGYQKVYVLRVDITNRPAKGKEWWIPVEGPRGDDSNENEKVVGDWKRWKWNWDTSG